MTAQEKYGVASIEMVNGVPSPASSKKIFDAMDYYGAVQAYLWAMPAMGLKGWENANVDRGADSTLDGQICLYHGYDGAAGILTPNTRVTYPNIICRHQSAWSCCLDNSRRDFE